MGEGPIEGQKASGSRAARLGPVAVIVEEPVTCGGTGLK